GCSSAASRPASDPRHARNVVRPAGGRRGTVRLRPFVLAPQRATTCRGPAVELDNFRWSHVVRMVSGKTVASLAASDRPAFCRRLTFACLDSLESTAARLTRIT